MQDAVTTKCITQFYRECPACQTWAYGQFDAYCSRCGEKLDDDAWLTNISNYAKDLLIKFLENYSELVIEADISEIPDYATEGIRANGNVLFNQYATRRILAECWNEVEIALDDWKENTGQDYPAGNIEQLHVFSVACHADMIWRSVTDDVPEDSLRGETLAEMLGRLERW